MVFREASAQKSHDWTGAVGWPEECNGCSRLEVGGESSPASLQPSIQTTPDCPSKCCPSVPSPNTPLSQGILTPASFIRGGGEGSSVTGSPHHTPQWLFPTPGWCCWAEQDSTTGTHNCCRHNWAKQFQKESRVTPGTEHLTGRQETRLLDLALGKLLPLLGLSSHICKLPRKGD